MRIAIVNDMLMAVEALRRVVTTMPAYKLAWVARDGAEAVRKCEQDRPDLILMDLIMPVMDGVEATRQIMAKSPCAILVVTANVRTNSNKVYEAMGFGALDAVNTPALDGGMKSEGAKALLEKIDVVGRLAKKPFVDKTLYAAPRPQLLSRLPPIVAVGASTGGPKAVAALLAGLPSDFPASIVLVQHIDAVFAEGLATWLDQQTLLKVRVAVEGARPTAGVVDVAATNDHLILRDNETFSYTTHPADLAFRPSVDVFFQSIASLPKRSVIGVLLTGIGSDGAQGMARLRDMGHHTLAQDEASCVVFGMPRAAIELKAAAQVMPPDQITGALIRQMDAQFNTRSTF